MVRKITDFLTSLVQACVVLLFSSSSCLRKLQVPGDNLARGLKLNHVHSLAARSVQHVRQQAGGATRFEPSARGQNTHIPQKKEEKKGIGFFWSDRAVRPLYIALPGDTAPPQCKNTGQLPTAGAH